MIFLQNFITLWTPLVCRTLHIVISWELGCQEELLLKKILSSWLFLFWTRDHIYRVMTDNYRNHTTNLHFFFQNVITFVPEEFQIMYIHNLQYSCSKNSCTQFCQVIHIISNERDLMEWMRTFGSVQKVYGHNQPIVHPHYCHHNANYIHFWSWSLTWINKNLSASWFHNTQAFSDVWRKSVQTFLGYLGH